MKNQSIIRMDITFAAILSVFGAACQQSKSQKFEQKYSVGTYSKSQMIDKDIEDFMNGEQYEKAVKELGELTPMAYYNETFSGLASGDIVIDNLTLEVGEDDISQLEEHYKELNLAYDSMSQMWETRNFDPYSLDSGDYEDAMYVLLDAISGAYTQSEESIRGSLSLKGFPNPIKEVKATVQFCQIAMRCKDNPGQAAKEFISLDNWKLVAEHQQTASFLAGAAHKVGKFQKDPFADVAHGVGKAMIACAPAVVGVAKTFGASLTTSLDEAGEAGAASCQEGY